MFQVTDKEGKPLHIEDVVKLVIEEGELKPGTEGEIIAFFSETEVQINPINAGVPTILNPAKLERVHSFYEELESVITKEDFLTLINGVEERAKDVAASRKRKTPAKRSGLPTRKKAQAMELDI